MKMLRNALLGALALVIMLVGAVLVAPKPLLAQAVGMFQQTGADAIVRSLIAKVREIEFSIVDYGAVAGSTSDATAAFTRAIAEAPSSGCEIKIPRGRYRISTGAIAVNKSCKITGAGRDVTTLEINHATADIFVITGTKSEVSGFTMTNKDSGGSELVTRTAGAYIKDDVIRTYIHDVYMDGPYLGVWQTDNTTLNKLISLECRNVTPHATASGSSCAQMGTVGSGNIPSVNLIEYLVNGDDTPLTPQRSCIRIVSADAPQLSNINCMQGQIGLLVDPGNDDGVLSLKITGTSFFDSTTVAGAYITQTGTGNVARVYATNAWFTGSAGVGVQLDGTSGGIALEGFECIGCQISLNGVGLKITTANWSDVRLYGGCYAQNTTAVEVPAAFAKFSMIGAKLGNCDGFTANTTGMVLGGGASSQLQIINNDFTGSTTPVTVSSGLSGTGHSIYNNPGWTNGIQFGGFGTMVFNGASSGAVTVTPQAAAGTPTITWPNATGTVAVQGTSPVVVDATTGAISVAAASDSASGIVELATTSETQTGTDTARAVTAAGVRAATREKLLANRTYYVRSDGNNNCDGLTNAAGSSGACAYATLQKAWDVLVTLDLNGFSVTISGQSGQTLTGALNATVCPVGGNVDLNLNGATLSTTSATAVTLSCVGNLTVRGGTIQTTTAGHGLRIVGRGAKVTCGASLTFGAVPSSQSHIRAEGGGYFTCTTAYSITGGALYHYQAINGGLVEMSSFTVTLSGSLTFTAFAKADSTGVISAFGMTYSGGTITGTRYEASLNALINTFGGGANVFPGNVAGTTATGGQYALWKMLRQIAANDNRPTSSRRAA